MMVELFGCLNEGVSCLLDVIGGDQVLRFGHHIVMRVFLDLVIVTLSLKTRN